MRLNIKPFLLASLLSVVVVILGSWGFLVHKTTGQLAIYELPKPMRRFFHSNMDSIVSKIIQPDLRRNTDPSEWPKHFIDLEKFGDSAAWKLPMHWNQAVKIYSRDSFMKFGYVPYVIIMVKEKLTKAFQERNKDSIVLYAADIGHYIGDANVPLHTSINYDGQLTNQKGLHSLWESTVPEVELNQYNLHSGHQAKYVNNPEQEIWNAIRRTYSLLPNLFYEEKQVSKDFADSSKYEIHVRNGKESRWYTQTFAKSYGKALGNSVNQQLLTSADMIADFWYTCWVDAGKPDLDLLVSDSIRRQNKKELKNELKIYKHNELIQKKLLLARKTSYDYNF